jgi:hypothetical protein
MVFHPEKTRPQLINLSDTVFKVKQQQTGGSARAEPPLSSLISTFFFGPVGFHQTGP